MNDLKRKQTRTQSAFTLVEMLVVIAIIGLLAGLIVGLAGPAQQKRIKSRVKTELSAIESAITLYHDKVGVYPPDGTNDAAKPPLFYELTGTKYNAAGNVYESMYKGNEPISPAAIQQVFGRNGFANSHPEDARNFFPGLRAGQFRSVEQAKGVNVEVLVVPVPGPHDFASPDPANLKPLNTWRYVSRNPTNNPNSYDLWAEVLISGKTNIIGNWKHE